MQQSQRVGVKPRCLLEPPELALALGLDGAPARGGLACTHPHIAVFEQWQTLMLGAELREAKEWRAVVGKEGGWGLGRKGEWGRCMACACYF